MKLIRFMIAFISFSIGILAIWLTVKTKQDISGTISFTNILKYPKLLMCYAVTIVTSIVSIKSSIKSMTSSLLLIRILAIIILLISIAEQVVEILIIKGGIHGIF